MCSVELESFNKVSQRIILEQKTDGGWIDCEDTAWNIFFLSFQNCYSIPRQKAIQWLANERPSEFGWGFCKRDFPNIPLTSQILLLVPEVRTIPEITWLFNEWKRDLNSPVSLNYKGAWALLVMCSQELNAMLKNKFYFPFFY